MRPMFRSLILAACLAVPGLAMAAPSKIFQFNVIDTFGPISTPGICTEQVNIPDGSKVHITGSSQISPNGNFKLQFHLNFMNVTGVGDDSGDPYDVTLTGNFNCSGNLNNGHNSFNLVVNGSLTDLDTLNVVSVHVNIHLTENANGVPTAEVENIQIVCPI